MTQLNLQKTIKDKRRKHLEYLLQSLTLLKKSFHDRKECLSDKERIQIIDLCLRQAKPLWIGLWEPTEREPVDLLGIIRSLPELFKKITKASKVNVQINTPEISQLTILGDPAFVEVLLANIIGKIIYRSPKGGKVHITLGNVDGKIQIQIQDNAYNISDRAARLINNAQEFFISDADIQQLCKENHIRYTTNKVPEELPNVTCLTFLQPIEESANRNVGRDIL